MWRRLRRLRTLSRREWRELSLACAWQVRLRLIILRNRGAIARLASAAERARPVVSDPFTPTQVERIARWSAIMCRGSCLTTAFVHQIVAARHGLERPVTIGVVVEGTVLRAHAWAGDEDGARMFASVWTDDRGTAR